MKHFRFLLVLIVLILLIVNLIKPKPEKFTNLQLIYNNAYYITVERFIRRQKHMEKNISKNNIQVSKFLGQDKKMLDIKRLEELQKDNIINNNIDLHTLKYNGSVACFLSHILLWKKLLSEKGEIFLILEDDCLILPDFNKKLNYNYQYVPKDWDMLWLGHGKLKGKKINDKVLKPYNSPGMGYNSEHHCYLLKKKSIPKLFDFLLPINRTQSKDSIIRHNFEKFNAYFLIERLAIQNRKEFNKSERQP